MEWQRAGHSVHEVSAFDDAYYRKKRGTLGRVWIQFVTYVIFPAKAFIKLCRQQTQPDTVRVVITSPFFLPALAACIRTVKIDVPMVNIVNDLFPDALVQARLVTSCGLPARLLGGLTRLTFERSDATIFLGERLRSYAEQTYGRARLSRIIPVGADSLFVRQTPPDRDLTDSPVRILYSGVMGHMHDTETIVSAFQLGFPSRVQFSFHSSGVGYTKLVREISALAGELSDSISLQGPLSDEEWRKVLSDYPIGLVTLKPGAQRVSMPSKTYSALAAGQAIFAICPADSDLADLIRLHDCGWVVSPGDVDKLHALLDHLSRTPEEIYAKRLRAFQAGHSFYDMARISEQYTAVFETLIAPKQGRKVTDTQALNCTL